MNARATVEKQQSGRSPARQRKPITWPVLEALSLRLALGAGGTFARCAGEWYVLADCFPPYGSGLTVAGPHRERGRALLEAIEWARDNRMTKSAISSKLAGAITGALAATPTVMKCPRCGARKVIRISFGTAVLGHSCRACKWERPS